MPKTQSLAERLLDAVEDHELDHVNDPVCDILQVFSIEDEKVEDGRRAFVFEDHSAAVLEPSEGLQIAEVQYVVEVEIDEEDADEDDHYEEDEEEDELCGTSWEEVIATARKVQEQGVHFFILEDDKPRHFIHLTFQTLEEQGQLYGMCKELTTGTAFCDTAAQVYEELLDLVQDT